MPSLNSIDKMKLQKFFEMGSGYVCDFNNFSFKNFILEYTGVDVYAQEYEKNGTSKANRLRLFWSKESNFVNRKLLVNMLEYWKARLSMPHDPYEDFNENLYKECLDIVNKLNDAKQSLEVDLLPVNSTSEDFIVLVDLIKENLKKNKHEYILDWLHTYVAKYVAELCSKHSISYTDTTPLHGRFGQYVRFLREQGLIESKMSIQILSSTIKILDEFNFVRNNNSFAHDKSC